MRLALIVALAASTSQLSAATPQSDAAPRPFRSATIARDVNGIALGMTVAELRQRMPITHVQGDLYTGALDGVKYEFGVTPRGRVYRLEAVEPLGKFSPDRPFTLNLSAKLQQKYGPPAVNQLPDGPMSWRLVENVTHADGQVLPFGTMQVDASLSDDWGDQSLDIRMQDYRILWSDAARLNSKPRDQASNQIRF